MTRNRQQVKFIFTKALVSAVFVLGTIAIFSITVNPGHIEETISDRSPASFQTQEEKLGYKMGVMTLKCETVKYESKGLEQIRLKGSSCKKGELGEITQSQIKNESLNTEATVFISSATEFTTDYITLARGQNIFSMKSTYGDGTTIEKKFSIYAD